MNVELCHGLSSVHMTFAGTGRFHQSREFPASRYIDRRSRVAFGGHAKEEETPCQS